MGTEHPTCPNCAGTRKSAALGKTWTRHGLSHTCGHRPKLVWEMDSGLVPSAPALPGKVLSQGFDLARELFGFGFFRLPHLME